MLSFLAQGSGWVGWVTLRDIWDVSLVTINYRELLGKLISMI